MTSPITLYGIPNCDSVKKARKQLDAEGINYTFIDIKTTELGAEQIAKWLKQYPDTLVNKRSTTYRQIKDEWLAAEGQVDAQIALIQAHPTVIKRPLIEHASGEITVGLTK